jgi:hypothetical protein
VLRSGWPINTLTLVDDELVAGPYNTERLANFISLNVRASRRVPKEHGELEWYIEVSNLLDRSNFCCLDYTVTPGENGQLPTLGTSRTDLLGLVPNFGMRWQF